MALYSINCANDQLLLDKHAYDNSPPYPSRSATCACPVSTSAWQNGSNCLSSRFRKISKSFLVFSSPLKFCNNHTCKQCSHLLVKVNLKIYKFYTIKYYRLPVCCPFQAWHQTLFTYNQPQTMWWLWLLYKNYYINSCDVQCKNHGMFTRESCGLSVITSNGLTTKFRIDFD